MGYKVSVVMPCFNAAEYVSKTVSSVLAQTMSEFELIIVDDGSDDYSCEIFETLKNENANIKLIRLDVNCGPGKARNIGIQSAKSNLIAFIDADDVWCDNKLEVQYNLHQQTGCAFSCTAFKFGDKVISDGETDYISLLKNNVINTSSVMFDYHQLDIMFSSEYKSEDYIQWLGVAKKTKIVFINQILVKRTVFDGLSSNKFEMAKKRWEIYRDIEKLGLYDSVYYFLNYAGSGLLKYLKL